MPQSNITRDSHYVPQATLRRWSEDGYRVWAYRLLVPHENVPRWELKSIKGLVCEDDLYTVFSGDSETDEFERLMTSIETPGQEAMEKLLARSRMSRADWHSIAKFVLAQQLRTPLHFMESNAKLERQTQEALEALVRKYEERGAIVADIDGDEPPVDNFFRDTLTITIEPPTDGSGKAAIRAHIKSPRSAWMASQRHHLTKNLDHVTKQRWRVAEPHGDEEWPLSDHPVLTLNYNSPEDYAFDAGWGHPGSEFILPISPRAALYARVGEQKTGPFTFSREQTTMLQRLMVERSFRWILARQPPEWVATERPREVNRDRFIAEQHTWKHWNVLQSEAEAEFEPNKSDSTS